VNEVKENKILFLYNGDVVGVLVVGSLYNERSELWTQSYMFGIRIPKPQAPGPGQGLVINDRRETEGRCHTEREREAD